MTMTAAFDHGMVTENQHAECLRQNSDSFECSCPDSLTLRSNCSTRTTKTVGRKTERREMYTQGAVASQNLWSRYDRHFVGIIRHNA